MASNGRVRLLSEMLGKITDSKVCGGYNNINDNDEDGDDDDSVLCFNSF